MTREIVDPREGVLSIYSLNLLLYYTTWIVEIKGGENQEKMYLNPLSAAFALLPINLRKIKMICY
jgi:hypothetical protein